MVCKQKLLVKIIETTHDDSQALRESEKIQKIPNQILCKALQSHPTIIPPQVELGIDTAGRGGVALRLRCSGDQEDPEGVIKSIQVAIQKFANSLSQVSGAELTIS